MDAAAIKTYRYLRVGMVGAVLLLAVSVLLERSKLSCWQTSISAYYFTPVRAIFVGGLLAIGLALIVVKGRTELEDVCLNIAGMFAPIVAVVPTTGVGKCWSTAPGPIPTTASGTFADWVVANVDNNLRSLLIAGIFGLVAGALIATVKERTPKAVFTVGALSFRVGLASALVFLGGAWMLLEFVGDGFTRRAHGAAAILMFAFLALAVGLNAHRRWNSPERKYVWFYGWICALMVLSPGLFFTRSDHKVLIIEALEITLFAAFWLVQTYEYWHETNGAAVSASASGRIS